MIIIPSYFHICSLVKFVYVRQFITLYEDDVKMFIHDKINLRFDAYCTGNMML